MRGAIASGVGVVAVIAMLPACGRVGFDAIASVGDAAGADATPAGRVHAPARSARRAS